MVKVSAVKSIRMLIYCCFSTFIKLYDERANTQENLLLPVLLWSCEYSELNTKKKKKTQVCDIISSYLLLFIWSKTKQKQQQQQQKKKKKQKKKKHTHTQT